MMGSAGKALTNSESHLSDNSGRIAGGQTSGPRLARELRRHDRYGGRVPAAHSTDEAFGAALLDCRGNLLGAGKAGGLAGEVQVPPGVDPRKDDLSLCFERDSCGVGGRRFPLVSATWVEVRSTRVRVGIYMETGERLVSPERLDIDLGRIAAILSSQGTS